MRRAIAIMASVSLDPRHRLPLADKADIDARRQEKFQRYVKASKLGYIRQ